ncbi:hypothetical protein B7486_24090 [cyanobacterium TDX16]|nr:hypothetical protein B7486_24090 [cyanobacterium TDX16]
MELSLCVAVSGLVAFFGRAIANETMILLLLLEQGAHEQGAGVRELGRLLLSWGRAGRKKFSLVSSHTSHTPHPTACS